MPEENNLSDKADAEIARLNQERDRLCGELARLNKAVKYAANLNKEQKDEIAKLKAENLELSHTPFRLAEVEAERDYFETELREARQALEQARKEQREKDAEIIAAMPDQPGYS